MLTQDHDATALRSLLETEPTPSLQDMKLSAQDIGAIMGHFATTTTTTQPARDARSSTVHRVPPELLSASFALLPFRDRLAASHVSPAFRRAAVTFPGVWCHIDVSFRCREPACLIETALSRSGQVPVALNYRSFAACSAVEEGVFRVVKRHLGHLRSVSWESGLGGCLMLSLDRPAPLLESFTAHDNADLSSGFLRGNSVPRALFVVNGACSTIEPNGADAFLHLSSLFPRLQSLELWGLCSTVTPLMPPGPAPRSLTRLFLRADGRGCDVAALYLAWKTETLEDVELFFPRGYRFRGSPGLPTLFAGAREIDYRSLYTGGAESNVTLRDSHDGSICRLRFLGTSYVIADLSAAYFGRYERMTLDSLRVLKIDITHIDALLLHLPAASALAHLTLYLHEQNIAPDPDVELQADTGYPYSLGCLNRLSARVRHLESIALELLPRDESAPCASDAQELFQEIKLCGRLSLPALHVRGFPERVVREIVADTPFPWNHAVIFD